MYLNQKQGLSLFISYLLSFTIKFLLIFTVRSSCVVMCTMLTVDCCVHRRCWCFTTRGLCTVGQDEVVIVLEQLPQEDDIPCHVLVHILSLYNQAAKGL